MATARRASARAGAKSTARAKTTKTKKKAAATRKAAPARKPSRPTIVTVAAQIDQLREDVALIAESLRTLLAASRVSPNPTTNGAKASKPDPTKFDAELLGIVADLDRTSRLGGLVPIPEIRRIFLDRGWSRTDFDARLLEAERDFVVDLKSANDPSRIPQPELAIEQPGRGHLQWVVVR